MSHDFPTPPDLEDDDDINYIGAAFYHQYNIITLLGLGALGLFVPGLWYMTAAAELAYLAMVPSDKRFQRSIRADRNRNVLQEKQHSDLDALAQLAHRDKRRYLDLVEITEKIRAVAGTVDYSSRILVEQDVGKLDYLLRTFLRMLTALTRLKDHLTSVDRDNIRRDIKRLNREAGSAKPRIKAVKQKNVEILNQRLTRLDRVEDDRELIQANLDTIEATLRLIRDNVVSLNNPQGISDQIDSVVTNMQENERLMESMASFLDAQAVDDIRMQEPASPEAETSDGREQTRKAERTH